MNKLFLIGNLTSDPVTRTLPSGITVCSFGLAVNRRKNKDGTQETDFFKVTAWRQLGEICQKYLAKGRKANVIGSVSVSTYNGKDGKTHASLDVTADDIELLPSKGDSTGNSGYSTPETPVETTTNPTTPGGFTEVDDSELPF